MSYLVLARKYRPSTFAEVVGQEHVTRTLANAFSSGRVHHAFLMTGPRGCGKTTIARIIGKAVNCENGVANGGQGTIVCGTCSACTSIANGSAVDYQEMDGASNRGIDAIRELTEAVRYQPAQLKKKVYVIDEVHMLTTEAFNALLKTLEEPPPHVMFVLATTEPHKLPNTILSRCQRYDFKLVPASRLAQHLTAIFKTEQLAIEPGAVSLLVRESGGSVRDALSLCDQIISYVGDATITEAHVAEVLGVADRSLTRTLVRALAHGEAGAALAAVEAAIERGVDEVQLARAIVRYLRDLSVLQVAGDRPELIDASDEERGELAGEARAIDRTRVSQMFERMLRCCDELGKTLQPRLVLDCALIDVATVEPLVPLGDLIDRLGELEQRIARGSGPRPTSGGGGGTARPTARPTLPDRPSNTRSAGPAMQDGASHGGASPSHGGGASHGGASHGGASPSHGGASHGGAAPSYGAASHGGASPSHGGGASHGGASPSHGGGASHGGASPSHGGAGASHGGGSPSHGVPHNGASRDQVPVHGGGMSMSAALDAALAGKPAPTVASPGTRPGASTGTSTGASTNTSTGTSTGASTGTSTGATPGYSAVPVATTGSASAPVSMQPSGPVPTAASVATGSGPHDDVPHASGAGLQIAIPSNAAEAMRAWDQVLGELERRKRFSLAGPLHHARVMAWNAETLELGFPVDVHSMGEMAADIDKLTELRTVVRELGPAQKGIRVVVRLLDERESQQAGARSVLETTREKTHAERSKREAEAREHPITKHVLQTFGAQIKEIKTDV